MVHEGKERPLCTNGVLNSSLRNPKSHFLNNTTPPNNIYLFLVSNMSYSMLNTEKNFEKTPPCRVEKFMLE